MRKYACCYAQGRPGAREFRKHVAKAESPTAFRQHRGDPFPKRYGLMDFDKQPLDSKRFRQF